jgi:hypothetical protein
VSANQDGVTLHPKMTAQQIAEWCAVQKMFVTVDYHTDRDGFVQAIITARREPDLAHTPCFFLRQAE